MVAWPATPILSCIYLALLSPHWPVCSDASHPCLKMATEHCRDELLESLDTFSHLRGSHACGQEEEAES